MFEVLLDTLIDSAKLVVFLFLSYLGMEYLESRFAKKSEQILKSSRKTAIVAGSLLGVVPQCGFAAGAASLFSGGLISAGALIAVFISSSDEMLPVMISSGAGALQIVKILALKVISALVFGFLADLIFSRVSKGEANIKNFCEDEHCGCEENGIFRSALTHTLKVIVFITITSFIINTAIYFIGEDNIKKLVISSPYISQIICAFVGLIPNCASSVILTGLFLDKVIGSGALICGLCANSGVGLMVLYRTNKPLKQNLMLTAYLLLCSITVGFIIEAAGVVL